MLHYVIYHRGAWKGCVEIERTFEMLTFGAYIKYSSTAFVTFKSRVSRCTAAQMLLSHDHMEIKNAPNPKDIIWDNVATPRSQIKMRNVIANIVVGLGSICWGSLVTSLDTLSFELGFSLEQGQLFTASLLLALLLCLPFGFDAIARYYEGMKLESEIQDSIMTRYFWYQLVNIYVLVGFGGLNMFEEMLKIMKTPEALVDMLGRAVPAVSLFFCSLLMVKLLAAIPLELIRPYQLSTILVMGNCMNRKRPRSVMPTHFHFPTTITSTRGIHTNRTTTAAATTTTTFLFAFKYSSLFTIMI